jgi:hypothetical protein
MAVGVQDTAGRITEIVFEEAEGRFRVQIPASEEPLATHLLLPVHMVVLS